MASTTNPALQWVTTSFQNFSARVSTACQSFSQRISGRIQNCIHPPPPVFDDEDIEEYMALTYLSKEEILRAYSNFCSMEPQFFNGQKNPFLPRRKVMNMPEFKVNPFKERMMFAVSTYEDYLTFEDYLEMMSAFSEHAPIELKAEYAFRIYDYDFDDCLSVDDLVKVIKFLQPDNERIAEEHIRNVAVQALMDGDVDGDGLLAFVEFVHLINRLEDDFKSSFTIRL